MARRIQIYPYRIPSSPSPYSSVRSKLSRLFLSSSASSTRRRHLALSFIICTLFLYYYYYRSTHSYYLIELALPSTSLAVQLDSPLESHDGSLVRIPKSYTLLPSDDPSFRFTSRRPCNQLTLSLSLPPASATPSDKIEQWLSPSPPLHPSASLDDRIEAFLDSPLSTHSVHLEFNAQTCSSPSIIYNTNQLHKRNNLEFWEGLKFERIREIREEIVTVLRNAEKEGRLTVEESVKRGLVWTAGNADTFDRVLVSLRLLRNQYNCHLPAEIFHFPNESPSESQIAEFTGLNARVISLSSLDKEAAADRTKSFHIKGSAFTSSSFTEILYLDSDSIPTRSPEFSFDSKEFKEYGAVFWGDFWKDTKENGIWRVLGIQCRDEWTMESGQVLIDKSRHLDALILLEYWLKDWRFWFRFSDGDKDLLRYAFLLLRKRWSIPSHTLASASWSNPAELGEVNRDKFAGHTMVQFGLASEFEDGKGGRERGRPLFVHGNLLKRVAGNFAGNGATWNRNLQLHLPELTEISSITSDNSLAPTSSPERALSVDDFVNVSPFTGLGITHSYSNSTPSSSPSPNNSQLRSQPETSESLSRRMQALLTQGFKTDFWDGHRGYAYVLAIQQTWEDELRDLVFEDQDPSASKAAKETKFEEWVKREEKAQCSKERSIRNKALSSIRRNRDGELSDKDKKVEEEEEKKPEGEKGFLQVVDWSEFDELKNFESRFYEAGGRANGNGFR
ncbi:hypothetical protein JCM3765_007298 [Sporobolomyces pararoseus]